MNGDRYVTIPSTCCSSETVEADGISLLIALTLSGSGCAPLLSYIVPIN